jgi:hypothetical protein
VIAFRHFYRSGATCTSRTLRTILLLLDIYLLCSTFMHSTTIAMVIVQFVVYTAMITSIEE